MKEISKAYLAGYFDADGCVYAQIASGRIRIIAKIAGRDRNLLEELKLVYGGYFCNEARGPYSSWLWRLTGRGTIPFLEDILPLLRLKKHRVELALELARTMSPGGRSVTPEIKTYRARLALEICGLNQAGLSNPTETTGIKWLRGFLFMGAASDSNRRL